MHISEDMLYYLMYAYHAKEWLRTVGGIINESTRNVEAKMRALLGEEFNDYIKCYEEPRYYGLRVNTKKISVEKFSGDLSI